MTADAACDARHQIGTRASVDTSSWDGDAAMSNCAGKDDPSACYGAICAGKKAGDADKQSSWALPHHKTPGAPPNAAGVRNALSRLPQTQGLTNRSAAEAHLNAHMKAISPDSQDSADPTGSSRQAEHSHGDLTLWDPDGDGDDDATPEGDTDHSHWDENGNPIPSAWAAAGKEPPTVEAPDEGQGVGMLSAQPPRDNLVRARVGQGVALRAAEDDAEPSTLVGMFSKFNEWYEVDSLWEGHFWERVLPGAFAETIANDRSSMRVLYNHGMDAVPGSSVLGPIRLLEERDEGPYYEVPLLDNPFNRDTLIPALTGRLLNGEMAGSQLGASFRFTVQKDQWNRSPKTTKRNPNALPERSIVQAKVYEFGPVTFPANAGATASARSLSDEWLRRLMGPGFDIFAERVGHRVAERVLAGVPEDRRAALLTSHQPDLARQAWLKRRARALLTVG